MSPVDVVVCIPTYRRPDQLARLLAALAAQRGGPAFDIVVGNNDERSLETYPSLRDPALPKYRSIAVVERGVTAVRNALVATVLAERPAVRWIACLDDDQVPADDWLAALVAAGERHAADLVGGPVSRSTPLRTFWSTGATDTSYLPTVEGPTRTLNEAGNLLLATRFLRSLGRPPFAPDFGRTGGEDYEFFLLAQSRQARIVWAPAARVDEPLPADRLTASSYFWRFYATAAYQARADRRYHGAAHVVRGTAREAAKGALACGRALVHLDAAGALALAVRYAAIVAGRAVGFVGVRALRYAREAGGPVDARPSADRR